MTEKPVISNTSPLIGLSGLNLLSLLRDLYTEVLIPREVEREFLILDEKKYREVLQNASWIRVVDLVDTKHIVFFEGLNTGEIEVFALAQEQDARLVIIDDQLARQAAMKIGLPTKGTVGVLLQAKEEGLIAMIKPLLFTLRENGLYLSNSIIADVLHKANEKF